MMPVALTPLNYAKMAPWFPIYLALKAVYFAHVCVAPIWELNLSALRWLFWISHGKQYIAIKNQTLILGALSQWIAGSHQPLSHFAFGWFQSKL